MFYELWDVRSGNLIKAYDTEDQALTVVRDLLAVNGPEYAPALSLAFEDDDERTTLVAKGSELAERAGRAHGAVGEDTSAGASLVQRPSTRRTATG